MKDLRHRRADAGGECPSPAHRCWSVDQPPGNEFRTAKDVEPMSDKTFTLEKIGSIRKAGKRTTIVLHKAFRPALKGLDRFSHVWVIWWFDRNDTPSKRATLQVFPRSNTDNPLTGVFACRAPVRPNLIAMSLCRVLSVKDGVVEIEKIEALSNTPVLDLKPYMPGSDSADASLPSWV